MGDSPIVGAGFYADAAFGGASATGHGEPILTLGLCRLAVESLSQSVGAHRAAAEAIQALGSARLAGRGGVLVLDTFGRAAAAFKTSRMARAWIDANGTYAAVDP